MQISSNPSYQTFKGYGARPLRGLFLRYTDIPNFPRVALQLENIGKKQGFDVFVQTNDKILTNDFHILEQCKRIRGGSSYTWCQDNITFLPNKTFVTNPKLINKFNIGLECGFDMKRLCSKKHIAGGNYFIIDNEGQKDLLLGRFDMQNISKLVEQLNINSIKLFSQADFHLDLFIRPLKNKDVLITDDKMWLDSITAVMGRIKKDKVLQQDNKVVKVYNKLSEIKNKLIIMNAPLSKYASISKVNEELIESGYNPIKVPGRIFEFKNSDDGIMPQHILNYMNAIVHVNKDGELVYITNKSNLNKYCGITDSIAQKIGFDFESEFIRSVKNYIKPENIYFVETQNMLKNYEGGIHCLAAEMP